MSIRACVNGVVRRLQKGLGDETGSRVGYRPTLRPPKAMGQWYVSVGQDTYTCNGMSNANGIDARYTVSVCVTFNYAAIPDDRRASLATHAFGLANATPEIAAAGRPASVPDPQVQPGLIEIAELCHDLLIQDYEAVKEMNLFLPLWRDGDLNGADANTRLFGDDSYGFCEPFHTGSMGVIQDASAEWVGGSPAVLDPGAIQTRVLTVSGARSILPARYLRGLDRDGFTD